MNAKELAQMLDGREYGAEISHEEIQLAKTYGLVVVHGASDDLMEICGAINDERDCYEGGTFSISKAGILDYPDCGCDTGCKYFKAATDNAKTIRAVWCGEGKAP